MDRYQKNLVAAEGRLSLFWFVFLPKIRFKLRLKRPLRGSVSAKSFRCLSQLKLAVMLRSCSEAATQKKSFGWGTNLFAPHYPTLKQLLTISANGSNMAFAL